MKIVIASSNGFCVSRVPTIRKTAFQDVGGAARALDFYWYLHFRKSPKLREYNQKAESLNQRINAYEQKRQTYEKKVAEFNAAGGEFKSETAIPHPHPVA